MRAPRAALGRGLRARIIDRAFYREVTQTLLVVGAVFVALYVAVTLVNLMARAAKGAVPVRLIFLLLGLQTVQNLAIILPLAIFISLLMTIGRWYRDSEMTVLAACGVGLSYFLRPTWIISTWGAIVVGGISFYLAPLSSLVIDRLTAQASDPYHYAVSPGQFNQIRGRDAVFYVEAVGANNS